MALLFAIGMVLGNGLQGTLQGGRASPEGFDSSVTGLMMSGFSAVACSAPNSRPLTIRRVGHLRVFAARAAGLLMDRMGSQRFLAVPAAAQPGIALLATYRVTRREAAAVTDQSAYAFHAARTPALWATLRAGIDEGRDQTQRFD